MLDYQRRENRRQRSQMTFWLFSKRMSKSCSLLFSATTKSAAKRAGSLGVADRQLVGYANRVAEWTLGMHENRTAFGRGRFLIRPASVMQYDAGNQLLPLKDNTGRHLLNPAMGKGQILTVDRRTCKWISG